MTVILKFLCIRAPYSPKMHIHQGNPWLNLFAPNVDILTKSYIMTRLQNAIPVRDHIIRKVETSREMNMFLLLAEGTNG